MCRPGSALLLSTVILISVWQYASAASATRRRPFGQLPTTLRPLQYRLSVQPFFPADGVTYEPELNLTFRGNLSVLIECLDDSDNVTMHMNRIEIHNSSVILTTVDGGWKLMTHLSRYSYDSNSTQVSFFFDRVLRAGQTYELNLTYTGSLVAEDLAGFYTSTYTEDGKQR